MPHISVKLYHGRSDEQKTQLAEAIVQDVGDIIHCERESFSVESNGTTLTTGVVRTTDKHP